MTVETSNDPLVTVGGGVDFPLRKRLAIGVDARYERAFGDQPFARSDIPKDAGWTRVGISVSYRH